MPNSGSARSGSADELVRQLRLAAGERGGRHEEVLVHEERVPARPAEGAILRPTLPRPLAAALRAQGVRQLYTHQVAAIQAVRAGQDVVVTTPTASGKTLCFNLPVLERALGDPEARALYLYPTKALLADQLRGLEALLAEIGGDRPIRAARLDGDVSQAERELLRADPPAILLANPDIVHHDVLARNGRWRALLANLRFVVVDELHAYRGVFGAHVGLILRRLLRLAARFGASPTIVAASATIANPAELAGKLTGRSFVALSGDGAGANARRFLLWRPPLRGSAEHNEHESATREAVALFVELIRADRTVILFGQSRVAVERMLAEARELLGPGLADRISGYKAGYLPEERRQIEADLREGRLRGVVATNALELGIDVGALDAAVLAGYPGSVMSTWQQAGRVGRRSGDEALILLVGADNALDQYYLSHPQAFFGQPVEQAVVDLGNESVLAGHLLCAAHEAPLREAELAFFPEGALRVVDKMVCERLLTAEDPWRPVESREWPHRRVSIRGVSRDQYQVVDRDRPIASAEPPHLYRECYPGAIYLHQGVAYRVVSLDPTTKEVRVRREDGRARTDPVVEVGVAPRGDPYLRQALRLGGTTGEARLGPIVVEGEIGSYRETVVGTRAAATHRVSPPQRFTLETVGLAVDFPVEVGASREALHAAEHALVNALPIALLMDRRDVGSTSDPAGSAGGRIYVFDDHPGGIGLAEKAYQLLDQLVPAAADLLQRCRCARGCPSCVHMPGCSERNEGLDKAGGLALLLGRRVELTVDRAGARREARPEAAPERPHHRTRRERVEEAEGADEVSERLRRVGETSLRERLGALATLRVGEVVDYTGIGRVVVLDVGKERAYVQFQGSVAKMWVPLAQLRRIEK